MSAKPLPQERPPGGRTPLLCPRGHEMRLHQVRIDRRRIARRGGLGGWERAVSYDQWVCDSCGHREPPEPAGY